MKILWLCNLVLPVFADEFNVSAPPYGGWIAGLLADMAHLDGYKITVCFDAGTEQVGSVNGIHYWGYSQNQEKAPLFERVIKELHPDLIHIWGTENPQSLYMIQAAYNTGYEDKVVVNIQGLVSVYSKYHYANGIPERIIKSHRPVEIKYGHSLDGDRNDMSNRGVFEVQAISLAKQVIGRTDWDEACVRRINPKCKYYSCNPTLRESFYTQRWSIDKCERHSIFVSQSNYPIKGFHRVLEAMPEVLKYYPDAKLYTTGDSPLPAYATFHSRIRQRSYPRYLAQLIVKYRLEDKVVFLGLLDEVRMCERFRRSHVFVSPSSIENESNSVGEAMLLGMPVVSSFVGGVYNFMDNAKEGYFYQNDASYMLPYYICKVFDDDERAIRMGECARKHALRSFNRKENLQKMLSIYSKIITSIC